MFDDVFPPSLGIWFTCRCSERANGVDWGPAEYQLFVVALVCGQRDGKRQVDGFHGYLVPIGPGDCLPFRAECGEGCEDGTVRLIDDVAEQRHRWFQTSAHPLERRCGFGGRFDQHN